MNRHARRAQEKVSRAQHTTEAQAIHTRVQLAHQETQRLNAMLQAVQQALGLASQIPVVKVEGEVSVEDDPNFFRSVAIEDFEERATFTRVKLIGALEELYLSWDALDSANQPLVAAPPLIVRP